MANAANAAAVYGSSLYRLAQEENVTGEVMDELSMVQDLLRREPDYVTLLSSHQLPVKERIALLDQAFRDALHPYALNTLKLLTEQGLMHSFGSAADAYRSAYFEDNGIAPVTVISAVALTDEEREALLRRLTERVGKTLVMTEKIDPSLVGGIRVELEGTTLDGSVETRLAAMRSNISHTVL